MKTPLMDEYHFHQASSVPSTHPAKKPARLTRLLAPLPKEFTFLTPQSQI
ncbi:hypothetical protein [Comamonas guangdongensis]